MYTTWYVRIVNSLPIYFQHLETAPKEILGDFPRMSRSEAVTTVYSVEAAHQQNRRTEFRVLSYDYVPKEGGASAPPAN